MAYYTETVRGVRRLHAVDLTTGCVLAGLPEWKDLSPFRFVKVRNGRNGWRSLTFAGCSPLLCELYVEDGILYGIDEENRYLLAFPSDPSIFYRVVRRRSPVWELVESFSGLPYLFVTERRELVGPIGVARKIERI